MELDRYDRAILKQLQEDARITNALLAEKVSLSESACLRRVVEFRESLQQLWNESSANQSVTQLRDWCVRAEASGIRSLREFAEALPTYARAPVRAT